MILILHCKKLQCKRGSTEQESSKGKKELFIVKNVALENAQSDQKDLIKEDINGDNMMLPTGYKIVLKV